MEVSFTDMESTDLLAKVIYFTKENSVFYQTSGGFASMKAFIPPVELLDSDHALDMESVPFLPPPMMEGGGPHGHPMMGGEMPHGLQKGNKHIPTRKLFDPDAECIWQDLGRVYFHRAFPFELPDKYISVMDKDSNEYGIIRDLNDLDAEAREIINRSLERKYYLPVIDKIFEIKEQFGYSYWNVSANGEKLDFSVRDTFKSIIRLSDVKLLVLDSDGNRFIIPDYTKLDKKSSRKIETYL